MSDTPKTEEAFVEADKEYDKGNNYKGIQVIMRKMEALERSYNELISKLEMLYADWSSTDYGMYANESDTAKEIALKTAAKELDKIIQESK